MSGNTKVLRKCLQLTVISCLEGQQNFLDRQESSLINKKIYIIFIYIYTLKILNVLFFIHLTIVKSVAVKYIYF